MIVLMASIRIDSLQVPADFFLDRLVFKQAGVPSDQKLQREVKLYGGNAVRMTLACE